jgi:hypothetical protein
VLWRDSWDDSQLSNIDNRNGHSVSWRNRGAGTSPPLVRRATLLLRQASLKHRSRSFCPDQIFAKLRTGAGCSRQCCLHGMHSPCRAYCLRSRMQVTAVNHVTGQQLLLSAAAQPTKLDSFCRFSGPVYCCEGGK